MPLKRKAPNVAQIKEKYALEEDKLIEKFKKRGFSVPDRPKDPETKKPFEPIVPSNLPHLVYEEIGTLNTLFTTYAGWVGFEAALADLREEEAEIIVTTVRSLIRFRMEGNDVDRADQARLDPEYMEAEATLQEAKRWKTLVRAIESKLNKDLRVISREITRRQDQNEFEGREGAMQGAKSLRNAARRHTTPGSRGRFRQDQ